MPARLSRVALLKQLPAVAMAVPGHSIFPPSDCSDIMSWLMLFLTGNMEARDEISFFFSQSRLDGLENASFAKFLSVGSAN